MATATRSWRWASPWALDRGRTEARPAAWASGCQQPRFCIPSRERRWDPLSPSPGEPQARGTCSCAHTSAPPHPSSALWMSTLGTLTGTSDSMRILLASQEMAPVPTHYSSQKARSAQAAPRSSRSRGVQELACSVQRAQLLVHMSSLKSTVAGVDH